MLVGVNEQQAIDLFINQLQESLACVCASRLHFDKTRPGYYLLRFEGGRKGFSAKLYGNTISLSIQQHFATEKKNSGMWKVRTVAYIYEIFDRVGERIIAYHWHPFPEQKVKEPHLHLFGGSGVTRCELKSSHIPTGPTAIEDLIAFLVDEFNVVPPMSDWRQIIEKNLADFIEERSWATSTKELNRR